MRSTKIIKICSSSLCTCLHHMVILRTRNKITDFSMILAWASPFNMTIWCKHVHRLELQKFFLIFCAAHLPVKRDRKTKFPYFLFWIIYYSNKDHFCSGLHNFQGGCYYFFAGQDHFCHQNHFCCGLDHFQSVCDRFFSGQDHFCSGWDNFKSWWNHFRSVQDHFCSG